MRGKQAPKRIIKPDLKYNSATVSRFINKIMMRGQKETARKNVYKAFDIIKDKSGKVIVEFPLTMGVVATALLPVFAAIGALAALIGECTIAVELEK